MNDAAPDANRPARALQATAVNHPALQLPGDHERADGGLATIGGVYPNSAVSQDTIPAPRVQHVEKMLEGLGVVPSDILERYVCLGNPNCPICHDDLLQYPASALPCHHVFHTDCLRPWLRRRFTCPTCRFDIAPDRLRTDSPTPLANRLSAAASPYRVRLQLPFGTDEHPGTDDPSIFWAPRIPARTRASVNVTESRRRSASPPRRSGSALPTEASFIPEAQPALETPSLPQPAETSAQPSPDGMDDEPTPAPNSPTMYDLLFADHFVRPWTQRRDWILAPDAERADDMEHDDGSGSEDTLDFDSESMRDRDYRIDFDSPREGVYIAAYSESDDELDGLGALDNDPEHASASLRPWECPPPIGGLTLVQWIEEREQSAALSAQEDVDIL